MQAGYSLFRSRKAIGRFSPPSSALCSASKPLATPIKILPGHRTSNLGEDELAYTESSLGETYLRMVRSDRGRFPKSASRSATDPSAFGNTTFTVRG